LDPEFGRNNKKSGWVGLSLNRMEWIDLTFFFFVSAWLYSQGCCTIR
jgi:hypothetical protein